MELYDGFTGGKMDPERWEVGQMVQDGQVVWTWRDRNLQVQVEAGCIELSIPVFSLYHDEVGIFDNPKALYFSKKHWPIAEKPVSFKTTLAAEFSGNTTDYKDGFASFHVLDFNTGTVLDVIANGNRLWAIRERLPVPGLASPVEPFIEVIDLGVESSPMQAHEVEIEYDPHTTEARWSVDGVERLRKDVPMDPREVFIALGLLTLHPQENGKSVSCKGQGGRGRWGAIWAGEK
ncbi:hypothetical protein IIA79_01075 [bacterium]|nr:hypothetical protein [bacterium]